MSKGRAENFAEYQDRVIQKFLEALGLRETITVNVVDKRTGEGTKRTFPIEKLWFFTPWLRAQNRNGREIFLVLPPEFLVLDDREGPLQGACNIETSKDSWHNILRFNRALSDAEAKAIKIHFKSDPSARRGTRLPLFKNTRKNFWVEWDGSVPEELDLDKFLTEHGIKVEQEKRTPAREGRIRRARRFREPDWSSVYQDFLLRYGNDYSRADFALALRLLDRMDTWEAVDVLKQVSLSFRPRQHQNKSARYWEHTINKALSWYRPPDWSPPDGDREPPAPGM